MNARKHRNRLSTLLKLSISQASQTQLSCLVQIDANVDDEALPNVMMVPTKNPNQIERQIQVDTIQGHFDDLCQVRIEIADQPEKSPTSTVINDERILQALIDRDGKQIILTNNDDAEKSCILSYRTTLVGIY